MSDGVEESGEGEQAGGEGSGNGRSGRRRGPPPSIPIQVGERGRYLGGWVVGVSVEWAGGV